MYKLRELEEKDISIINKWRIDKSVISTLGAPYRFINKEVDMLWYQSYLKNRENTIRCAIVESDDIIRGLISLTSINYINRSAIMHIMVGPEFQNRGVGSFAVKEIIEYAFETIGLNRIELAVLSDNENAIKLYKKNKFQIEGTKREACYKDGKYKDMYIMSLLKKEY